MSFSALISAPSAPLFADVVSDNPPTWAGVLIALIGLATLIVTTYGNQRAKTSAADVKATAVEARQTAAEAKTAVENVAGQLVNNGGSTALDKIQAGHREILGQLRTHDERLNRMEVAIALHTPVITPLPPPPPLLPAPSIITPELDEGRASASSLQRMRDPYHPES